MDYFATQVLNGLSLGAVYALIALGFAIVYGVLKFLNFAHSEVFATGAFAAYFSTKWLAGLGLDPWLIVVGSLIVSIAAAGVLASLLERIAYRPLRGAPATTVFLSAVGVSIFLQYVGVRALGAATRGFPEIALPFDPRIAALVTLVASFAAVMFLVYRTPFGFQMRAVSENHITAELMGVDSNFVILAAFFLGGALAGVAGVIWGLVYGVVSPQMGFVPGLKSFMIAVIGSIGRLEGTVMAGVVLGVLESLIGAYAPSEYSALRDPIIFVILLTLLVLRPGGLILGEDRVERV